MSYALVSILKRPGAFDQPLTYELPKELMASAVVGSGVLVPLKDKEHNGIILEICENPDDRTLEIKKVIALIPELSIGQKYVQLAQQIADYYQCSVLRALKLMLPGHLWKGTGQRILKKIEEADYKSPNPDKFPVNPLKFKLTPNQKSAISDIKLSKKPILLHGVTSSGKTEIYLRAILECVNSGKQAILLVPEIGLTPQMTDYFFDYFGDFMAVFHSKLSDGQRLTEWMKVKKGYARLVIGSRSAIFAPCDNPGLVIIDEEHEWTYKQESSPYYETHWVAEKLQELTCCKIILGTATPRLETLHKAETDVYDYVKLRERINKKELPKVEIVDLRDEFKRKNYSIFSHSLFGKIKQRLENKEQIILFVNQRGLARAVVCRDCGYTRECPSCEVSLKLHSGRMGYGDYLMCHYCGFKTEPNLSCRDCGSVNIKHVGIGTQRVEQELHKSFPNARVIRADRDTTSDKSGFEPIYNAFKNQEADILVGTQMVAKGLDFPNVTLIGIVLADVGLHVPDFRSHERLFHLITQVSGRAGRGQKPGEVVLQTYQPDHHAIKMAADYQFDEFAQKELAFRKKLKYPPFNKLVKFTVLGPDLDKLQKHVQIEKEVLEDIFTVNKLVANVVSAPAMIAKTGGFYYYNVLVRSQNPHVLFKHWKQPKGWRVDIDPVHTA